MRFTAFGMVAEKSQTLFMAGVWFQDAIDILLESHVQHFIGLIENHPADRLKFDGLTVDQIQQAAWCGHHDLGTPVDQADLIGNAGTAIYGNNIGFGLVICEMKSGPW